jgi:hypothetical protein
MKKLTYTLLHRFDLETFVQGGMWGGQVYTGPDTFHEVIDAFYHFALNAPSDVDGGTYSAFAYSAEHKTLPPLRFCTRVQWRIRPSSKTIPRSSGYRTPSS